MSGVLDVIFGDSQDILIIKTQLKVNFYLKKSCFSLLLAIFDHFSWKFFTFFLFSYMLLYRSEKNAPTCRTYGTPLSELILQLIIQFVVFDSCTTESVVILLTVLS